MRNLEKYRGIIPAFYACYDKSGNIDTEAVKKLTQYFIDKGVKGLYVNGSSGECIYLTVEENKKVLDAVMEVAKGKLTIIAHVARNNTKESMELAAYSEKLGVDAIASIPPIYFKLSEKAIAKYWNDISSAAPNTDFIIYNIPQLAGVSLTPSLLREMLKNKNVVGVKNSSMPVLDIETFVNIAGEDYIIFNGPDEQYISGRIIGAGGGIGGTYGAMPELFVKLDELLAKGDLALAKALQVEINNIIRVLTSSKASMYAVIKEVLRINENLDLGGVREPLLDIDDEDREVAKKSASLIKEVKEKYLNK